MLYQGTLHFKRPDAIPRQGKKKKEIWLLFLIWENQYQMFFIVMVKEKTKPEQINNQLKLKAKWESWLG